MTSSRGQHRMLVLALIGMSALAIDACASAEAASRPVVYIDNGAYSPSTLHVPLDAVVSWQNRDSRVYTVTSMANSPAAFDSGSIQPGAVYTRTFTAPGTYFYSDKGRGDAQTYGTLIVGAHP